MISENITKATKNKNDNPFIEKEGDIILNRLMDEDRKVLQNKLVDLSEFSKGLSLEYKNEDKKLEYLEKFQEELNSLIEHLEIVYALLKKGEIKNINELEKDNFSEKDLSNLVLEIDFRKIFDFATSSNRSFLSLYSACKNLQAKIVQKKKEVMDRKKITQEEEIETY